MDTFNIDMQNFSAITEWIVAFVAEFGVRLVGAIIVLIAGLWVAGKIGKAFRAQMEKRGFDPSLRGFLGSLVSILLKILIIISVLGMVGVQMTSFIAILGAAGLAIGMALSGTLQNFAGGILLLILKPFKSGDFIEAQGFLGTVNEIQVFNTVLTTPDNKKIIIPNGGLATGAATNFSAHETRRVEWVFGIAYGDNYEHAKKVLLRLIGEDQRVLPDPEPFIVLSKLNSSSVDITVRVWVKTSDFWSVFFDLNEKVYQSFEKEGLHIPFPQMDVHLRSQA